MRNPGRSTYTGCFYIDGRFTAEREDKVAAGILKRPVRRWATLLKALAQGYPGKLSVECKKDCVEGGAILVAAWRDIPGEPLQLSEAVDSLPEKVRSQLQDIQRKGFDREFGLE